MTANIFSPSAAAVKPRRHPRFRREDIPAPEIAPVLKAFGQVLRTLELKRAFN
ncbi:hypothetical protein DPU22_25710 [Salmonella enterica subsp. enterica serovar Newport]|uniref:Uncharacterized protein n=1 Tax=Salmonella enterica I TaxID=59201 RepID=A0A3V2P1A4_SALET|nr:hypothetical protein [Salmonella enterica subsp. enterica serovar Newport]EBZ2217102.1 hypothetical protein [Salmonella enterica subsp. enterica serovar Montevideo]EEC4937533.1 hypothetical protein [Salmonella enterica subsp. enterica serovar Kasenyi]EHW6508887.1 hypothetical protein [Salmonella enterica]EBR9097366.1 hypothetical protein [Salmonella enterica subsp. enterica serovar Newport]